jgi:hypothetical protein
MISIIILETAVGRKKNVQDIGVHGEIKKSRGHLGGTETFLYFARVRHEITGTTGNLCTGLAGQPLTHCENSDVFES